MSALAPRDSHVHHTAIPTHPSQLMLDLYAGDALCHPYAALQQVGWKM